MMTVLVMPKLFHDQCAIRDWSVGRTDREG